MLHLKFKAWSFSSYIFIDWLSVVETKSKKRTKHEIFYWWEELVWHYLYLLSKVYCLALLKIPFFVFLISLNYRLNFPANTMLSLQTRYPGINYRWAIFDQENQLTMDQKVGCIFCFYWVNNQILFSSKYSVGRKWSDIWHLNLKIETKLALNRY